MEQKTRVLIVDDQRLFAEGLRVVFESRAKDFEIVDIAENGQDALTKVQEHSPDVVLMDVRMPVMDGVEATLLIHQKYPQVRILMLTTFDDDEFVKYSIQNGAIGYLLKNRPPDELIDSIRALHGGILQIDPAVSGKLFHMTRGTHSDAAEIMERLETLTTRECEVLKLLIEAERVPQIARHLAIAEQTVRNHTSNIYSKLSIHNKIEIIRYVNQIRFFLDHHNHGQQY